MYGQSIGNFVLGWHQQVLFLITCSNFISFLDTMEVFTCGVLKKESKEFLNKTLPEILPCNYCNIECCKYHSCFLAGCKQCRKDKCNKCKIFNIHMSFLVKNANNVGKNYIFNFVLDFLNVSEEKENKEKKKKKRKKRIKI